MSARYVFDDSKVPAVIRAAYSLSEPQGLGFLHFKNEPLSDDEVKTIMGRPWQYLVVGMDYVNGRAVKLDICRNPEGACYIPADRWYDHDDQQLKELARIAELGDPQQVAP